MLERTIPLPAKFVSAFIYREEEQYISAKNILQKKFGPADFESEKLNFNFTNYYANEMGKPLFRRFLSFQKLCKIQDFVKIKLFCIKLERKFSEYRKRRVNIDPGYITEAKFVLTTTKDYSHRIYLGKGIYAEVELYYSDGGFYDFSTTYPDYRTPEYKRALVTIREIYHEQITKFHKG